MTTTAQLAFEEHPPEPVADAADAAHRLPARTASFTVSYGMVSHGLAPLVVDGEVTQLDEWGFSPDILRRVRRLSELYDRQIDWDAPGGAAWGLAERDRTEFNALLLYVFSEVQLALGSDWVLVLESEPL